MRLAGVVSYVSSMSSGEALPRGDLASTSAAEEFVRGNLSCGNFSSSHRRAISASDRSRASNSYCWT